jgi:hypothetical protein
MTTLLEASKAALEALAWADNGYKEGEPIQVAIQNALTALRTAIADADAEKMEPVATLHDDGYWTWKGTPPYASSFAGWRMDVYAAGAQPAPKQEPLSSILTKWKTGMICGQDAMVLLFRHYSSNPTVQAQPAKQMTDGAIEFKQYLTDCDQNAIEPDVAGAFNAGWQATHGIKEQP